MNATSPLTNEQIAAWTPAQQLESLARLARVVMSQRSGSSLDIPPQTDTETQDGFLLLEHPIGRIRSFAPSPEDRDLIELNCLAANPRNRQPFTEEILDQIAD